VVVEERVKRHHIQAIPAKARLEIRFPRVEGYTQGVRNRVTVDWPNVPPILLDPCIRMGSRSTLYT